MANIRNEKKVEDVFSDFGFSSPFSDMGGAGRAGASGFPRGVFGDDIFSSFRAASGGGEGSNAVRKAAAIERTLPCSLEDLFKGTTKKMKISREVIDSSGRLNAVEEIISIEIKRGWKKGTRITFPGKGNERGGPPADLVFVIDEKPHSVFARDGNDLIVNHNVSLVDALSGYRAQIITLDGRVLNIAIDSVISPGREEVVKGEGMPIQREVSKKGDLRIKFNVKFPNMLTAEEKSMIRRAIPSSRFL